MLREGFILDGIFKKHCEVKFDVRPKHIKRSSLYKDWFGKTSLDGKELQIMRHHGIKKLKPILN